MKVNTNRWNRIRYTLYTPVYDKAGKIFSASRKKAIADLNIKKGDRVLLIGAGTGLDLEYLPKDCFITATDLTPSMIERMKQRNGTLNLQLETIVMDGQKLLFPDDTFDKIILHLILAVIPNPVACMREAERVLKPGGTISVFDKFVPSNQTVTFGRKMLNIIVNLFFSDITRKAEHIVAQTQLKVISDVPADFRGQFRRFIIEKPL
ncbi:MAG TPA: class I SAM-dependent methyltransferase [Bacteroidales bacterium]|nr:class I SAM-dependent methyltransferase [Bacteroidales bacterium]